MAGSLELNPMFTVLSVRVKCVDLHPTEPLLLCALYDGEVAIWNYEITKLQNIKVSKVPVRAAKFIPRKNWIVTGCDDLKVRVFNYNTLEQEHVFEAHSGYIRCVAVHPTQPYMLTCGDDLQTRLWNWESNLTCQRKFKEHEHFIMHVVFNPKDHSTFASASLDKTVKVWQLDVSESSFTLHGHEKGVNCVDYLGSGPYLVSGGEDYDVKIWDYQNRTCVRTLKHHSHNVTAVCFLPNLSMLLTASEDGTVGIWPTDTYRLEAFLDIGFGRAWTMAHLHGSNRTAIGFDECGLIIEIGSDKPTVSMDAAGGKIICAKNSKIQQVNLKTLSNEIEKLDGETLPIALKDMGSAEFSPKTVSYSPNGRFVAMCGEKEYVIYTAVALRSKALGVAQAFVWASNGDYAILTNCGSVKIFSNFKEIDQFHTEQEVSGMYGGRLLGMASEKKTELCFYDWESLGRIARIAVRPRDVYWSESGELVCIVVKNAYHVLRYEAAACTCDTEDAFKPIADIYEVVTSGVWVTDCFLYTDSLNRIKYFAGGEVTTVTVLIRPMYIIGYVAEESRIYLIDRDSKIVTYTLPLSVLEYQTAVLRGDLELAECLLSDVPIKHRASIAQFLVNKSLKVQALAATIDPEDQYELALSLGELEKARVAAEKAAQCKDTSLESTRFTDARWARLGNAASAAGDFTLAETCYRSAKDYSALLLLACSTENKTLLLDTARLAKEAAVNNVAFVSYFVLGSLQDCLDIILSDGRLPEAAFFARSYMPSMTANVVKMWKESLGDTKVARAIADPEHYANLFPEINMTV